MKTMYTSEYRARHLLHQGVVRIPRPFVSTAMPNLHFTSEDTIPKVTYPQSPVSSKFWSWK